MEQAGKYDIIHLAMHTVLNSRNPASSGMIFYGKDNDPSRYLQPYEIESSILNARMVVLSSCYTGAGTFYAGEGVLSLARRFIFAGSHSVVMSLWEVNDRSGTAIMKEFYKRIKSGHKKSDALREARISYLANADMLRSHPYFWSTLVIYGDDSPLYLSSYLRLILLFVPAALLGFIYLYFRKRR
jgi:CHAT domain-containing protein